MRLTATAMLFIFGFVTLGHAQRITKEESSKPTVYLDSSDTSPVEVRDARKAYADKFRVIEPEPSAGFAPGGVKGTRSLITLLGDPRSTRGQEKPGEVSFAFVVTPDGRVTDVRILHSTDAAVSKFIADRISYDRYFPAHLRGAPVASLHIGKWKRGGEAGSRASGDGLGVYHSRDR